jgi:hypothetical protein
MPNKTTPTIIRRYYPTLSSIINSDDIPEVLGSTLKWETTGKDWLCRIKLCEELR